LALKSEEVNPVKNADRILQGLPGWEPIAADVPKDQAASAGSDNSKVRKVGKAGPPRKRAELGAPA
jgi:hypothetical protein